MDLLLFEGFAFCFFPAVSAGIAGSGIAFLFYGPCPAITVVARFTDAEIAYGTWLDAMKFYGLLG